MTLTVPQIDIEAQGGFFRLHVERPDVRREQTTWKRGKVLTFSRRSRKRLIELFARLSRDTTNPIFLTLTYPSIFPSAQTAKNDLRAFLERLKRRFPEARVSLVWRMEFQKRGAPHFHLVAFNLPFLPKEELSAMWRSVIRSDQQVFTRIERVRSSRRLRSYVSKYLAKPLPQRKRFLTCRIVTSLPLGAYARRSGGFNSMPYLHARPFVVNPATGEIIEGNAGRFWGIMLRKNLPFAEAVEVTLADNWHKLLPRMKRYMRRAFPGTTQHLHRGGVILCTDALRWIDLIYFELMLC